MEIMFRFEFRILFQLVRDFEKKYQLQSSKMSKGAKLTVGGFIGGHSGVDIHEQRGNALKFLFEIINLLFFKFF